MVQIQNQLDVQSTHKIKLMEIIKMKANEGVGVFLIMHDLNLAAKYSNRIALMSDGSLVKVDTPINVLDPSLLKRIYNLDMSVDKETMKVSYF